MNEIEELRKRIPSFESMPTNIKTADGKDVVGVILIKDGPYMNTIIAINELAVEDESVKIDYAAIDAKHQHIEGDPELEKVVGDLIYYFILLSVKDRV